jgi:hypothetical protein
MSTSLMTGIFIFVIAQGVVATNLVLTLRRERDAHGKTSPSKLLLALLPMLVVDAVFVVWLLRQLKII